MDKFVRLLLFLILTFGLDVQAQIRVRLLQSLQSVQVKGIHLEVFIDGRKIERLLDSDLSQVQIERPLKDKERVWAIRWNGEPQFRHYKGHTLELRGLSLRQGSLSLPRRIRFHSTPSMKNKFDLISSLDLEVYLSGVLPKEMPSSWPIEALKAQAVASRSYAVVKMKERKNFHFDVEANIFDQAFEYSPAQYIKTKWSDKIQKVIQSTKDEALFLDQQVIKAFYHADCGGKTELASQVWGGKKGYDGAVLGCYHPSSGGGSWSHEVDKKTLSQKLKSFFGVEELHEFSEIEVTALSPSGRVKEVLFSYLDKSFSLTSQRLRQIVGFSKLKSTLFKIESIQDKIVFSGQGNGHGVGMCQHGAKKMAESGKTYTQILEKYFPATQLKKLKDQAGE